MEAVVKNRKALSQHDKAAVWDKTGGKCRYCGNDTNPFRDFTIDHDVPWSKGGSDVVENLWPCCKSCNSRKGDSYDTETGILVTSPYKKFLLRIPQELYDWVKERADADHISINECMVRYLRLGQTLEHHDVGTQRQRYKP